MQRQPAAAAVAAGAPPPPPPARRQHRQRLQVTACHRCLLQQGRQLIPRQLPCSSGRGLSSAASLKEGSAAERQAVPDTPPTPPQQAGAQPPAEQQQEQQQEQEQQDSAGVRAALAMLRFYKAGISPLLPPACRFLPTCSSYAMDAFQRHGVGKGFVLTAWRLMRCTPWGNSGYDPVRWPPPGLEFIFRE